MPKFYCEYCSIYLTHSSPAGRKQHSQGRKHINAKVDYYQKLVREQFFQPPSFLNHQVPVYGGFPMMGMIPPFPPIQPNNIVPNMDSKHIPFPPQGMIPPIPSGMAGPIPGPPGPIPAPTSGSIPLSAPPVPVIPGEMPSMPVEAKPSQATPNVPLTRDPAN